MTIMSLMPIDTNHTVLSKQGGVEAIRAIKCDILEVALERSLEALDLFVRVERGLPQSLVLLHEGFEPDSLLGGCELLTELGVMGIMVDIGGRRHSNSVSSTSKKERKKERSINVF
jgi:hypothetical protein